MKTTFHTLLFTMTIACMVAPGLMAQSDGFIYGKVTTIDGKTFEGPLRWGKEEVFWTDMFNTGKYENNNLSYLSNDQRRELDERYGHHSNSFMHWVSNQINYYSYGDDDNHTHQFVCQFGELRSLRPYSRNRVEVVLQNGDKFEVSGEGYNDIGTDISILDGEIGEIEVSWGRVETIEFSSPSGKGGGFGAPLFGTVETYSGTFTGYIQWDHDERISTDKLDGDTRDGDVSIPFENIQSISREGYNSSMVALKSGRDMELHGSNDVNSENRGIIVTSDKFGRVDIPWSEFKRVEFSGKPSFELKRYSDFKDQSTLEGTVITTDGASHQGRIIYDLDEEHNFEVLQGKEEDIEYTIPLRNVKSVTPKNYDYSYVELKNGQKLLLGDGQDVSDMNTGMLIFSGSGDPVYVPWEKVKEVRFN